MAERRQYDRQRHCPIARTLDVVGDRWTLLILRDLSWRRQRFSDLEASLAGIAPNLLSARLRLLEGNEMVERIEYHAHPPRHEYRLTPKGKAFVPILRAIADYGTTWEPADGERHITSAPRSKPRKKVP